MWQVSVFFVCFFFLVCVLNWSSFLIHFGASGGLCYIIGTFLLWESLLLFYIWQVLEVYYLHRVEAEDTILNGGRLGTVSSNLNGQKTTSV